VRGDLCEKCGEVLDSVELIDPKCEVGASASPCSTAMRGDCQPWG